MSPSNPEGESYVVDDCCDTDSPLGIRAGEQLHDGRVYPYFACARNCSGGAQHHSGPEAWVNDSQILIYRSYGERNKRVSAHRVFHKTRLRGRGIEPHP